MTIEKAPRTLPPLEGTKLAQLPFQWKHEGDLLYQEGPLLGHLISDKNEDMLIKWCDKDAQFHRWMIVKTPAKALLDFFNKVTSLRDLVSATPDAAVVFVETDNQLEWQNFVLVEMGKIPLTYLPYPTSHFDEEHYEPYALELKTRLEQLFTDQRKTYKTKQEPVAQAMEPPTEATYRKAKK